LATSDLPGPESEHPAAANMGIGWADRKNGLNSALMILKVVFWLRNKTRLDGFTGMVCAIS
jgi:hypothetical protein